MHRESNYPVYGAVDWKVNMEPGHPELMIKRAATSPALKANPDSRLVILDCSGVEKVRIQLTYYRWVWGRSSTWGWPPAIKLMGRRCNPVRRESICSHRWNEVDSDGRT